MAREMVRQGGRSARIQKAVHETVRTLLSEMDRGDLTVPLIAERAGVTPSTIYRRWGDLGQLLADVAVERMRPITDPDDTGSTAGDLEGFILQYAEEMSSGVGQQMLRDMVAEVPVGGAMIACCQFTYDHLEVIRTRALERGEPGFAIETIIDETIAPIVYHILFRDRQVTPDYCRSLLATLPAPLRKAA